MGKVLLIEGVCTWLTKTLNFSGQRTGPKKLLFLDKFLFVRLGCFCMVLSVCLSICIAILSDMFMFEIYEMTMDWWWLWACSSHRASQKCISPSIPIYMNKYRRTHLGPDQGPRTAKLRSFRHGERYPHHWPQSTYLPWIVAMNSTNSNYSETVELGPRNLTISN